MSAEELAPALLSNGPNAPQDVWVYAAPLSSGLLSSSIATENAVGLRAF